MKHCQNKSFVEKNKIQDIIQKNNKEIVQELERLKLISEFHASIVTEIMAYIYRLD